MMERNSGSAHGMLMPQGTSHHHNNPMADMSGMGGLKTSMPSLGTSNSTGVGQGGHDMHLKPSMLDMPYKGGG